MSAILFSILTHCAIAQSVVESKLRKALIETLHDSTKSRLLGELAWEIKFSKPAEALQLANREIEIANAIKSPLLLADGYRMKGLQLVVAEKIIDGMAAYDSCLKYARIAKSDYYQASCYSFMAGMYSDHGDLDKSIELYSKGFAFAKSSNDPKIILVLSNNLATAYKSAAQHPEKVFELFKLAKDNAIELKQWKTAAMISTNLAQEYFDNHELQLASDENLNTLQLLKKDTSDQFSNALVYYGVASIYHQLKNENLAESYCLHSIEILSLLKVPDNLMNSISTLVSIYISTNKIDKAELNAQLLLQLAQQQSAKIHLRDANKYLSDISKLKKDYQKSLHYFEVYKNWNDSVFNETKERNIEAVETKSMLIQHELEIKHVTEIQKKQNKQLVSKNSVLKGQILLAILACVMLGILGFALFFLNRKKEKLVVELLHEKRLVQQQSNEKGFLIQEIHHRVKNNLTMLKSLLYLQSSSQADITVKNILSEIQGRIQSMALAHENFYNGNQKGELDVKDYLWQLFTELSNSFNSKNKNIQFNIDGKCRNIEIAQAMPLILMLNELATNSIKYAFTNIEQGEIKVNLTETNNLLIITYADNGAGLKEGISLNNGGFGFKLLNLLTQQLDGNLLYELQNNHPFFTISIPLKK